jgi:hypothetical protein
MIPRNHSLVRTSETVYILGSYPSDTGFDSRGPHPICSPVAQGQSTRPYSGGRPFDSVRESHNFKNDMGP